MSKQDLTRVYSGSDLSGATTGVIYLPIVRDSTLEKVSVRSDAAQSGDAVFEVRKNGTVITGLSALTIANAAKIGTVSGLSVALTDGDEIVLNLLSGNVSAPVTLNLATDDGLSSGGGGSDFVPVNFQTLVGMSESGGIRTKTASTAHGNAGGFSSDTMAVNGIWRIIAGVTTYNRYLGLSETNGGYSYSNILFAWKFTSVGTAVPMESGVDLLMSGITCAAFDVFDIRLTTNELGVRIIEYYKNDSLVIRSPNSIPTTLHPHFSVYENGGVVGEILMLV